MKILIKEYKIDNLLNGLVNYSKFCEDVDLIFTKPNIEKDPLAKVN